MSGGSFKDCTMRKAVFAWPLLAAIVSGCVSQPSGSDIDGIWINQRAIETVAKGLPLLETLRLDGSNLEWDIDGHTGKVIFSNGFETDQGRLLEMRPGVWSVKYNGQHFEHLRLQGQQLIQSANRSRAEKVFEQYKGPVVKHPQGAGTFRQALYFAYMGGSWKIVDGPGAGNTVRFDEEGEVQGLPGADNYGLCIAGDCASQSNAHDSLWTRQNDRSTTWIFKRMGKKLEILQAVNTAQADEMPSFTPGERKWLLEKQ